jgi:hypothetical protein
MVLLKGVDRFHRGMRQVHDLVLVAIGKDAVEGLHAGAWINDDQLAFDVFPLEQPGDHHRPLVRSRCTTVRTGRNRHDEVTALELTQLPLQGIEFIGDEARRIVPARVLGSAAIVAEPGRIVVADADGQHQPVVLQCAAAGNDAAPIAVNGAYLGVHKTVALLACQRRIILATTGLGEPARPAICCSGGGNERPRSSRPARRPVLAQVRAGGALP